ncbi:transporter substrate-binding domain-containing protein [Pseudoalteromonas sp. SMS1]|uniref:transporter substrate-binding domain-containing protein n=1 Tax=Pseudoalteromonas sp. SMS1 TaxID=2908894 RepID=UPI001F1670AF|nr:transporter substrate-binding domain-containing protein [Pseudoalteromonas sp. SMS1]MCF2857154.1 transporter substrate-binding domain-containing protein [Pseudoalteromonas sp. SMS1]
MLRQLIIIGIFMWIPWTTWGEQANRINLYTYHDKPPYIMDLKDKSGLYFDIVRLLNEFHDDVQFQLVFRSKNRIRAELEKDTLIGAVLGVNPIWFGDNDQTVYLWSDPLFYDTDEFVSSVKRPFDYENPTSLHGQRYGGVQGYFYPKLHDAEKLEKLERVNVENEKALLELVLKQQIDFAVVSRPTFFYYARKHGWWTSLYLSHQSHQKYYRAILVPKRSKNSLRALLETTSSIAFKKHMKQLVSSYHIAD